MERPYQATILAVDDDERNLRYLEALLAAEGHAVRTAASGEEALAAVARQLPDLILLDVMMPGLDGFEVTRRLKADACSRAVPVILVTALEDRASRLKGLDAGAEEFLSKPVDRAELSARVKNLLKIKAFHDFLADHNRILEERVEARTAELQKSEERYRRLNAELEQRVAARTAQLEAANADLESFSYSVSHDLRAPLRAIDGFSAILREDYAAHLDEEGQRLFRVVSDNARKMGQLIDDILAFSRAGRHELQLAALDMAALAQEAWRELEPQQAGRAIEFRLAKMPAAAGDPSAIRQVWLNLLANAIKFSRGREPAVIEAGGATGSGENVYHVRDNGVGFDMAYADKLFGMFRRLHGMDEFEGTGVGLAIVKRFVAKHGGRVWAQGAPGEGATFWFALPNG